MQLKYLRVRIFRTLISPFSKWSRGRRSQLCSNLMKIHPGMSVLDLGGQPMIWDDFPAPLRLTILNLPGNAVSNHKSHHTIAYVDGDACSIVGLDQRSFNMIFSNSVIEHVGPPHKQAEFAREVRKFGKPYWIQTPAIWFPMEPHCGMPFWWFYPASLQRHLIERWRKKLPGWTEMVETTTVLMKSDLQKLFPEAKIYTERFFGIPKSYVAYFAPET